MANDSYDKKGKKKPAQDTVLLKAVKERKLSFVRLLVRNGLSIDCIDGQGKTALMWAGRLGYEDIVRFLLESGADHVKADDAGMTAVHHAAFGGFVHVLHVLTEFGADLEAVTIGGQTALHFGANGHLNVTGFLLNKGLDVGARDRNGHTALHWAVNPDYSHLEIVKLLVKKSEKDLLMDPINPLTFAAARAGNLHLLVYLKQEGCSIKSTSDEDSKTLLHEATYYDKIDVVRYLVEEGLEPDLRNGDGWTSLHIASVMDHLNIALLLLSSGADINAKTLKGSTPLKLAVLNGNEKLIQVLTINGADIEAVDDDGKSILDVAAEKSDLKTTYYLVEKAKNQKLDQKISKECDRRDNVNTI